MARASSIPPIQTFPYGASAGVARSVLRRGPSTRSTPGRSMGPISDIGSSSSSSSITRPGSRSVDSARAVSASIHFRHEARCGKPASRSMMGSAISVRLSMWATRRSMAGSCSSRYRRTSSSRKPPRRLRHRSGPPITAASTNNRSHNAGVWGSSSSGNWPSERYSANRDALKVGGSADLLIIDSHHVPSRDVDGAPDVGPRRAVRTVRRNPRPPQRFDDQRLVPFGGPEQNSSLVKRYSRLQDPSRDFDTLQGLTGGRKDLDGPVVRPRWDCSRRK